MFLNLPLSLARKFNGSAKVIKVGVANEDVTCRILTVKGPYTTARRAYTSFSSHCRPNVNLVQKSMQDLVAAGLGIFKVINKVKFFFIKCCPVMTFSRSWPNKTSLRKTTEQHSSRMMTSLLQAISSQCQRVIHFKLNSMHLEREQHYHHCFS